MPVIINPYAFGAAACAVDLYSANRVFFLRGQGANGATPSTDETGKTLTWNGNAAISTARGKFYASSLSFDGTGDYVEFTQACPTGDFTFSEWLYPNTVTTDHELFSITSGTAANFLLELSPSRTLRGALYTDAGVGIVDFSTASSAVALNAFQHVEFGVSGSTGYLFVNGVLLATGALSGARSQTFTTARLGRLHSSAPRDLNAYVNDAALYNGVCLHTSSFTPPTLPPC